jgi:hypothetical protein
MSGDHRQLNPPKWIDDAALRFRAIADENKKERGYPVTRSIPTVSTRVGVNWNS